MVSLADSSRHSTIHSSKPTMCSSKTIEMSYANPPPLMDELAQVSTPQLTLTIAHRLIRANYDRHTQGVKFNMHFTSRLAWHFVPNAYPFPQFIQLCVAHFDSTKSAIMSIDGNTKIFVINSHTICKMFEIFLGTIYLHHASQINRFRGLNEIQKNNIFKNIGFLDPPSPPSLLKVLI